ncbi:MAG: hypothetical protein JST00_29840 [Deltaproteobacteria bacterium]|nr:hypothetical protein [Deltaproteobacteria bacterium]
MRWSLSITFATIIAALAGCSSKDGDAMGEVAQSLSRAELPRTADLHYDIRQPAGGGGWSLDVSIRPLGAAGRRVQLTTTHGGSPKTSAFAVDSRGSMDRPLDGASPWSRLETLSVPNEVAEGREWKPFSGAKYDEAGSHTVLDSTRTFRVIAVDTLSRGTVYRAVYNVRPHVVRSVYADGTWPYSNSVRGVGIAEYFVPRGTNTSTLVASAEYHFLMESRPGDLAVNDANELRARIAGSQTFLTLTCLRKGSLPDLESTGHRPDRDRGLGLELCDSNR